MCNFKKGFTLVELLGVLIILGVILSITLVSVNSILSSSRNSLSDTQIKEIEKAAEVYYLNEGMKEILPQGETACVNLNYLIENGYIESKEIRDINSDKNLEGSVLIKYESNSYSYKYKNMECE